MFAEAGFDGHVEALCAPHYRKGGRPGISPGVYFRMVFVGYFEGLDSQRGIAWRCAAASGCAASWTARSRRPHRSARR